MNRFQSSKEASQQRASTLSLPTLRDKNYRFLNLRGIEFYEEQFASGSITVSSPQKKDVVIEFLDSSSSISESYLSLPKIFENDLFAETINQRWKEGYFIGVASNSSVVVTLTQKLIKSLRALYSRVIIEVGEGANLELLEELSGEGDSAFVGTLVEVHLKKNSKIEYLQAQSFSKNTKHFARHFFSLEEGATMKYVPAICGGERTQIRTEATCQGKNAKVITHGAVRGDGVQQFDFWINTEHNVKETQSQTEFWSVLGEKARAQFNGNLKIGTQGAFTDASQTSHNLMISDRAEMVTQPNLEIATDDVKCAHGAYIQSIDEEQLYYLASRGVPQDSAKSMIINGFTEPVLSQFPKTEILDRLRQSFQEKREIE